MKEKLKNIAAIQMGYSFRSRLEIFGAGSVAVIQMKDLTDENIVDLRGLMHIDLEKLSGHHLAKPGDIMFRSRGLTSTAAILADDPGVAVVAAPLLRIRVTDNRVLPMYLHWFINQPPAQAFLASHAKGTAQKMISKKALENMEITIPPLERQRAIMGVAALAAQEKYLMERLADKRNQCISAILMQRAEGE